VRITITIDTNNSAWEDDPQQLRKVVSQAENWLGTNVCNAPVDPLLLFDVNGNTTGSVRVTP